MEHLIFEIGLAVLLMALATYVAGKFKPSAVPLLIIIGLAVGPHLPYFGLLDLRFIDSKPIIDFMGRLGVLFLLFYLGLEFSLGRLLRAGHSIAVSGTIYIAINLTLGLCFGWALGWPVHEVLVVAGITTISSSAIVAKVITDLRRSARPETGLVIAVVTTALFIVSLTVAGRFSAPYLSQWLRGHSEETFLLFTFAILFL